MRIGGRGVDAASRRNDATAVSVMNFQVEQKANDETGETRIGEARSVGVMLSYGGRSGSAP